MRIVVLACLLVLTGCAAKKPTAKLNMLIPRASITKDVELIDCDKASPPHCKSMKLNYVKGTEIIEVTGYCADGFEYTRDADGIGTCKEKL